MQRDIVVIGASAGSGMNNVSPGSSWPHPSLELWVRWKNHCPTHLTTEVTEDTEGPCPLVHHPLDPVLESSRVKVDQETRPVATQLEVRQKLGFVYGSQLTHRLQFHDHRVFNDEIDSVPKIDSDVIVYHRQFYLGQHLEAAFAKLIRETRLITPDPPKCIINWRRYPSTTCTEPSSNIRRD